MIKPCRQQDKDDRPDSEQQWCLYTADGSRLLGRHPTKESAEKQERAVQYFKHSYIDKALELIRKYLSGNK